MYNLAETSAFHAPPSSDSETYIYELLPYGNILAAISSDDCLRFLDPFALENQPLGVIKRINAGVTCLKGFDGGENVIATAGRDGRVSLIDGRTMKVVGEVRSVDSAPILSLACTSSYGLAAGTELTNHQATISIWDTRSLQSPTTQYTESHSDDVTELQFHPSRPQILLSGSTDGLVNIYDTTVAEEEDALHQTINHGASIHHANFLSDLDIFALSHDEKFSMYELVTNPEGGVEEPAPVHYGDMREKLGGEYVAGVIARPGGGAVMGVGTHSKDNFDLIQLQNNHPWVFSPQEKVSLAGAHGSEIVRSFCFLDSHQTILTAGEDGHIKSWRGA